MNLFFKAIKAIYERISMIGFCLYMALCAIVLGKQRTLDIIADEALKQYGTSLEDLQWEKDD